MTRSQNVQSSSLTLLTYHSLSFRIIPEHIDASVLTWHEFQNSVAAEIGLLYSQPFIYSHLTLAQSVFNIYPYYKCSPHFPPKNCFFATEVTFLVVVPQYVSPLMSPKFHFRLDRSEQNWFCYYKRKACMINHHENHVNYSLTGTSLPTTWLLAGYRNTKQDAICTYVMNITLPLTLV